LFFSVFSGMSANGVGSYFISTLLASSGLYLLFSFATERHDAPEAGRRFLMGIGLTMSATLVLDMLAILAFA
jgi:hypothetical protein